MKLFPNSVIAWFGRLRRSGRARELRRLYLENLRECAHSLDERVAHHLHHVDLYWSRCIGFADMLRPVDAGYLSSGPVVMVLVGSEEADEDVRAYAAGHDLPALRDAWDRYLRSLVPARRGTPDPDGGLRRAAEAYEAVLSAYPARESLGARGA